MAKSMDKALLEMKLISQNIQLDLLKGNLDWDDERVQFFIPVVLTLTDFDWLKLIAEHTLFEEDEMIVKNFLEKVEALKNLNSNFLHDSVHDKLKRVKEDFDED